MKNSQRKRDKTAKEEKKIIKNEEKLIFSATDDNKKPQNYLLIFIWCSLPNIFSNH